MTDAFPWDEVLRHLIRDCDGAFGPVYTRRIRAMEIRDHPTAPRSPWQNAYVERVIGSIRRNFGAVTCVDPVAHTPTSSEQGSPQVSGSPGGTPSKA